MFSPQNFVGYPNSGWKLVGVDLVHLTEEGCEIWAASLNPLLEKLTTH